jgi:hypothetical protein
MDQFIMHINQTNPNECNHKIYMENYLNLYTECLKVKQANRNINNTKYDCDYFLIKFLTYHNNKNK